PTRPNPTALTHLCPSLLTLLLLRFIYFPFAGLCRGVFHHHFCTVTLERNWTVSVCVIARETNQYGRWQSFKPPPRYPDRQPTAGSRRGPGHRAAGLPDAASAACTAQCRQNRSVLSLSLSLSLSLWARLCFAHSHVFSPAPGGLFEN